jgi:hypothetical protein
MYPQGNNHSPMPNAMQQSGPSGGPGQGGAPQQQQQQHVQGGNMPNGVPQQRPGSVQMGGSINMAHQPTPMAMQPTGPLGNLQPNTMNPGPGNTNMMMTPQIGGNVSRSLLFILSILFK